MQLRRVNTLAYSADFGGGDAAAFWVDYTAQDDLAPYDQVGLHVRFAAGGSEPSDSPSAGLRVMVYPSPVVGDFSLMVRTPSMYDVVVSSSNLGSSLVSAANPGATSIVMGDTTGFARPQQILLGHTDTKHHQINQVAGVISGTTINLVSPLVHALTTADYAKTFRGCVIRLFPGGRVADYVIIKNEDSDPTRKGVLVADLVVGGGWEMTW